MSSSSTRRVRRRPVAARARASRAVRALLAAWLAVGCSPLDDPLQQADPAADPGADPRVAAVSVPRVEGRTAGAEDPGDGPADELGEEPVGLLLQLQEVDAPAAPRDAGAALVPAEPLAAADVERLLARLPERPVADEPVPWRLRGPSLPPPLTGDDVTHAFPPADGGPAPEPAPPAPLTVTRRAPEGEVPLAGHVTVAFSQPMVELAAVGELAERDVPVTMQPELPGRWRWLGTSTLVFEGEPRLPMASHVDLEVPAGTRSLEGGVLEQPARWRVSTPPASVRWMLPSGESQPRQAIHLLAFDQPVDPADVLARTSLRGKGLLFDDRYGFTPVSHDELLADDELAALVEGEDPARFVAFRPDEPLPLGATVEVELGEGLGSLEGPRTNRSPWSQTYAVHGPLELVTTECGWNDECRPFHPWVLIFNNELDVDSLDDETLRVEPPVVDLSASVSRSSIRLTGRFVGGTDYVVTVGAGLADVFGQTLGRDVTAEFEVEHAEPGAHLVGGPFIQLDPFDAPALRVRSMNVPSFGVVAWALEPEQWGDVRAALANRPDEVVTGAFTRIYDAELATDTGAVDVPVETVLDLAAAFPGGSGLALVRVRGSNLDDERTMWAVAQRGDLAVDAQVDGEQLLARVSDLRTGEPVAGADVHMLPSKVSGTSDARGLAVLALPRTDGAPQLLVASHGARRAALPESTSWWRRDTNWQARDAKVWPVVHAFDDRGTYKPGERAHVKGWVRLVDFDKGGDVGPLPDPRGTQLAWQLRDARGAELGEGSLQLDAFGGFALALDIPDDANLGDAQLRLQVGGGTARRWTSHRLRILEFRRPEYEVGVSASHGAPLLGESTVLSASARYYAGGGLADAPVDWVLTASPARFSPPGWDGFHFGPQPAPPWMHSYGRGGLHGGSDETQRFRAAGHTDASGAHTLQVDVTALDPPRPMSVAVEAAVEDVNRQRWAARTALLVHPSAVYAGARLGERFVGPEDELGFDVVVADRDGALVAGRDIHVEAARLRTVQRGGEWVEERDHAQQLDGTSADAPVAFGFTPGAPGRWSLVVETTDAAGRLNRTELTFWVSGSAPPTAGRAETLDLTLVPSSTDLAPGDTLELLVLAPFENGHGLLSVRRGGVVDTQAFAMDGASHVLRVPVADAHVPGLLLQVDVVGQAPRAGAVEGQPPRPVQATSSLDVVVRPDLRRLQLAVTPDARELEPGDETGVDVRVTGADGQPVSGAQVALMVVDEAVLALGGWSAPDPLAAFHPRRSADTSDHRLRDLLVVAEAVLDLEEEVGLIEETLPMEDEDGFFGALRSLGYSGGADSAPAAAPARGMVARKAMGPPGSAAADDGADAPVSVRSDLSALAVFEGGVPTDADGRVRVPFTLPDSLTRYRVTAVAVDPTKRAGTGESSITARLPLMLRPSPPRFLSVGDACELPLVVQNGTDADMTVELAAAAAGLQLLGVPGRRVTVPADDRVELRLPARADAAGTARLAVVVADVSDGARVDAASLDWPVWTPATTEAFATYGELDDAGPLDVQAVRPPPDVLPGFGGLSLSVSTTQVAALTDAVLHVSTYPYGCTEQRASRMLGVAALAPVLEAFEADGLPDREALAAQLKADIAYLASVQQANGGFGFWSRTSRDWPFLAPHVGHALLRVRDAGRELPDELLPRTLEYLADIRARCTALDYDTRAKDLIEAYALWVRHQAGEAVFGEALDLLGERGVQRLPLEASGWLTGVLVDDPRAGDALDELLRFVHGRVVETAAAAHLVESWDDADYLVLSGDRRADAVWLDALLRAEPDSDLPAKLVRGLLGGRRRGHWGSTQENAWVLVALARFFDAREGTEPDLVARAWLDGSGAFEQSFVGRSTERHQLDVPMDVLVDAAGPEREAVSVVVQREGEGRLYYRLGLSYAPADLQLEAESQGFEVERVYEAIEDEADVRRDDDGSWRVRLGAPVRVTLTLRNRSRRTHVALVDPLPAGFEAVDPDLAVTASVPGAEPPADVSPWSWWRRNWFEHQSLRDERAEVFTSWLSGGVRTWSYVARATTPGRFVVGPPKAEEMYAPETFGRGATDVVVVE